MVLEIYCPNVYSGKRCNNYIIFRFFNCEMFFVASHGESASWRIHVYVKISVFLHLVARSNRRWNFLRGFLWHGSDEYPIIRYSISFSSFHISKRTRSSSTLGAVYLVKVYVCHICMAHTYATYVCHICMAHTYATYYEYILASSVSFVSNYNVCSFELQRVEVAIFLFVLKEPKCVWKVQDYHSHLNEGEKYKTKLNVTANFLIVKFLVASHHLR